MGTNHLYELLFGEILIRCPYIEDGARNLFGRRLEDKFNCAGRVSRMHVRTPKLLAEDFEVLFGQHLHSKFVHRQIETHAGRNAKNGGEPQWRGAPSLAASTLQ